jgi:hypothetical protein
MFPQLVGLILWLRVLFNGCACAHATVKQVPSPSASFPNSPLASCPTFAFGLLLLLPYGIPPVCTEKSMMTYMHIYSRRALFTFVLAFGELPRLRWVVAFVWYPACQFGAKACYGIYMYTDTRIHTFSPLLPLSLCLPSSLSLFLHRSTPLSRYISLSLCFSISPLQTSTLTAWKINLRHDTFKRKENNRYNPNKSESAHM